MAHDHSTCGPAQLFVPYSELGPLTIVAGPMEQVREAMPDAVRQHYANREGYGLYVAGDESVLLGIAQVIKDAIEDLRFAHAQKEDGE